MARRSPEHYLRPLALCALCAPVASGCEPAYVSTSAPADLTFELACEQTSSATGLGPGLRIDLAFAGGTRQYALGCEHRAELLSRLQSIADLWCDGIPVSPQRVGGLVIDTTTSELTRKRGATIDDGQGYTVFQCEDWLPKLLARLKSTGCCGPLAPPGPGATPPGPPPSPGAAPAPSTAG